MTPSAVHSVTGCPSITSTPMLFQRALRIGREVVGKARQHARAGLDQHDARLVGVDVAEVRRQRVLRQLGDGAGELDAGRAGADDDEGQQRRAPLPDRSRARRARRRPGCAAAAWWRPPASSGPARTAPIRHGRNRHAARRWRAPACRRAAHRRRRAARACPRRRRRSTVANSVVTSLRSRSRWRIGQAISEVASEAVATW